MRAIVAETAVNAGIVGWKVLPWIGFDHGGVLPNSISAAWKSSIGNVTAGSVFTKLVFVTMAGKGILLFGGKSDGLTLLTGLAAA